jgi:hypothetical protein
MASTEKSTFIRFQSLVTILTPVIVAVGGFYGYLLQKDVAAAELKATAAQNQIAEIETSIRNVEAMETYFKMMGGDNDAEAKMAAYALYMLNKDDPEMAVSMIMAPGKDYLVSVLIDLGSREPKIFAEVQKILATQDDSRDGTDMQKAAQKIIWDIGTPASFANAATDAATDPGTDAALDPATVAATDDPGAWCYLGDFGDPEDIRIVLDEETMPEKGIKYTLNRGVNLRSDYPNKANGWKPAGVTGIARDGDEITIVQLDIDKKKRVWAKVSVGSR